MKLWSGLRPGLQKALLTIEKLSPGTARWNEVVDAARCHEIASKIDYKQSGLDQNSGEQNKHTNNRSGGHEGSTGD